MSNFAYLIFSLWKSPMIKFAGKVFPFKRIRINSLAESRITLQKTKIDRINTLTVLMPCIAAELSIAQPGQAELGRCLQKPELKREITVRNLDDQNLKGHEPIFGGTLENVVEMPPLQEGNADIKHKSEPIKRGGRPRGEIQGHDESHTVELELNFKPEIVCIKTDGQWMINVELPEIVLEYNELTVCQNRIELVRDETRNDWWHLNQGFGQISIRWSDNQYSKYDIGKDNYLLFKLNGPNKNSGRLTHSPTYGSYLVVVSEVWERDEELSGPPPVVPEPVSVENLKAHFFIIDDENDKIIAFRSSDGKIISIQPRASRFELIGKQLLAANENTGPLFGVDPPRIRTFDKLKWKDIKTIIIGEEGSGKNRWRKQFSPDSDYIEQELPHEINDRRGGWYFLRFYDINNELVESTDFRFVADLREIKIEPASPLPSEGGHKSRKVEFIHEHGFTVQPADDFARIIKVEYEENKATLTIPPDPVFDETKWQLFFNGEPKVEAKILIERIWWSLGIEEDESRAWKDVPLPLSIIDFSATSNKVAWLRMPKPRWISAVYAGFRESDIRQYTVNVAKSTVAIPLRDFGDVQNLESCTNKIPIDLWLDPRNKANKRAFGELSINFLCKYCDFKAVVKQDLSDHLSLYHLYEIFRPLNYQELRKYLPSLPSQIYKCSICDYYIPSDNRYKNPTDAIYNHGCRPVQFRVISDINEIRENYDDSLPSYYRCMICENDFKDEIKNSETMRLHAKSHISELIDLT